MISKIIHRLIILFFVVFYALVVPGQNEPVFHVLDFDKISYKTVNRNGDLEEIRSGRFTGVSGFGQGYEAREGQGRNGSYGAFCDNSEGGRTLGLSWSITLSQSSPEPIRMKGWSRAEDVEGSPGSGYSLYIDVIYMDDTPSWGHNAPFQCGTHGWQEESLLVIPEKPIQRISAYALFRGKKGRVWFDDITVEKSVLESGMVTLDGLSVATGEIPAKPAYTETLKTGDLTVKMNPSNGAVSLLVVQSKTLPLSGVPGGFLVRDVGTGSGYFAFENGQCEELKCKLDLDVSQNEHAIVLSGTLEDLNKQPRAMNLLYALPVELPGGMWGDHVSGSRIIQEPEDYHSWVQTGTGSNGQLSRYPFACVSNSESGIALGYDFGNPCQWRLGYSSGAKILYLSLDLGLHPSTRNFPSKAQFKVVIYAADPKWSFRSAAERYYKIFPEYFVVRSTEQGIWMPFTDISTVEGWQDFGFMYKEGTNNIPFDDNAGILTFRYSEPSTWWMNMDVDIPRTYEAAMEQVNQYAQSSGNSSNKRRAQALLSSGSFDENGRYQMQFRNEPWANGAVFSLNANPYLPGDITHASMMWNDELAERLYGAGAKGTQDGEYLDSLEGYVTADLNFREEHFVPVTAPLSFTMDTHRLVIHKAFSQYEFTRYLSDEMHSREKLLFANSVPYRFSFLCPWIDVMGTESNWVQNGVFSPNSDEIMNYRRTLIGQKPYLFLMNTDFNFMSYAIVEQYFQRCLFYGMFPSMFSHNAAQDPYWKNPDLYNRDRPLFKKYQPIIKKVAEAGWEPVTLVRANDEAIRLERFGSTGDPVLYLTVMNPSSESIVLMLSGEGLLKKQGLWKELLSGKEGRWAEGLKTDIGPDAIQVYRINIEKDSAVPGSILN